MRHEQGCGQRPRAVSIRIQYSYCSRTCTTIRTVCVMVGCVDAIDPAFGRFCSAAHAGYVFSFTHFIFLLRTMLIILVRASFYVAIGPGLIINCQITLLPI